MRFIFYIGLTLLSLCCANWVKAQNADVADVQKIQSFIEKIKKDEIEAANAYSDLKDRRVRMQEDLDEVLNGDSINSDMRKNLASQLKTLKKQEKIAYDKLKSFDKKITEVNGWIGLSPQKLHKKALELDREDGPVAVVFTPIKSDTVEVLNPPSKNAADNITNSASATNVENPVAVSDDAPKPKTRSLRSKSKKGKSKPVSENKQTPAAAAESTNPVASSNGAVSEIAAEAPPVVEKEKKTIKKAEIKRQSESSVPQNEIILKKYNVGDDVALNPPTEGCKTDFEGRDQLTGKKRKDFTPRVLFTHTEDFMKPQFKDKEYITCEAQGIWVEGGARFLNLFFTIQSRDAPRSFGFLEKGATITFILVNGKAARFNAAKTDVGTVDVNANITVYHAVLLAPPAEYKLLTESEVNEVKVVWSTGFETYEVYETDLMMNIIKCMDK